LVKWSIVLDLIYIIGRLWIMIHTVHIVVVQQFDMLVWLDILDWHVELIVVNKV